MGNRRANSVIFGFDFQINAAIVLMLENIKELSALKLEGNYEDIEIELNDGRFILAQAKAVVKSSYDFENVRKNLNKALITLSEGDKKVDAKELILITNSLNPLKEEASRGIFHWGAHRKYDTLPPSSQKIIDDYLEKIVEPLDKNKFKIQVLPFETDEPKEKYKVVRREVDDFIGKININRVGISSRILEVWQNDIFHNGTLTDVTIRLKKKDIIWPIIVIITDIEKNSCPFEDDIDEGEYSEILSRYKNLIDYSCERYEVFIKVLSDFNSFKNSDKSKNKILNFIEYKWKNYIEEFNLENADEETTEHLVKIILYNIIKSRYTVDQIKKEVNL